MNPFLSKLALRSGFLALGAALVLGFAGSSSAFGFDPQALTKQFDTSQRQQLDNLLTHERKLAKQFKASQAAQQKEFNRSERTALHQFFAADHTGPDKRAYVHGMIARRVALRKQMAQARAQEQQQSSARVQALREEQQMNRSKFQDELKHGQRPDDSLWPQPSLQTD